VYRGMLPATVETLYNRATRDITTGDAQPRAKETTSAGETVHKVRSVYRIHGHSGAAKVRGNMDGSSYPRCVNNEEECV